MFISGITVVFIFTERRYFFKLKKNFFIIFYINKMVRKSRSPCRSGQTRDRKTKQCDQRESPDVLRGQIQI